MGSLARRFTGVAGAIDIPLLRSCAPQHLVERDRQLAHTHARSVVDSIRNRRRDAVMPISPIPFTPTGFTYGSSSTTKLRSSVPMSLFTGT